MEAGFEIERVKPPRFPRLKQKLDNLPTFLGETQLLLKTRTYYFRRESPDDSKREAWAAGGSIAYESGWFMDRIKIGTELFTSQKLHGPRDRGGTGLLAPVQRHYNVLGQAYALLKLAEHHEVSAYRQVYDLPYVNKNDSRMTPNTFEGYSIKGKFKKKGRRPKIEYIGGYIAQMKKRNADHFVPMGEAAGAPGDADEGTIMGGLRVSPTDDLAFGAINYYTRDVLNIFYAEGSYTWTGKKNLGFRLKAQITDQRSVGDDRLTGSSFKARVGGAELSASYKSAILRAAFSAASDNRDITSPFGSYPGYVSLMRSDFNSAGENAWLLGFSYDFKRLGLKGLSAFTNYASGYDLVDPATDMSLPNEREIDVTVDYKVPDGRFRGFWVRLRGGFVDHGGAANWTKEYRVIVNYEIPLL